MAWTSTGSLEAVPALQHPELLSAAVAQTLAQLDPDIVKTVGVAAIDPSVADTAAFCERYGVAPDASANCVVVKGKRGGEERYAACVVLATSRADVNGAARRHLDVRKASFAATEVAVAETGMEYGGVTPNRLAGRRP